MENKTKDTITQVIGFDFGHAETAVTKANMGATTPPEDLEVQGQAPMVTAVAETGGQVLVGEDAYKGRNPEGLKVAFKSRRLKDPETRRPTKLFIQRIVEILIEKEGIAGGAKSLFVVGRPSGWKGAVLRDYEALLQETGMQQVKVVAESRAAFLAACESSEIPISLDELKGSVLIIDIGSSTTDFTVVDHMEEKYVDFGSNELGAGILDKIILERSLNAELKELFEEYPQYKAQCLLDSRKVKEDYFNSHTTKDTPAEIFKKVSEKRIPFDVEIGDVDMKEILSTPIFDYLQHPDEELHGFDWPSAFRKELQGAREETAASPPQIVLLTGGASRMDFVRKYCKEVFPNAKVEKGGKPQFTIARGLAWAGRRDDRVENFGKEINHVLESGELQKTIRTASLKKLIDGIVNFLVPELERIILSTFRDWRNGHISTLNGMESATESRIKHYLESLKEGPGAKKLGEKVIKDWIDTSVSPVVNDLFTPICEKARIPDSSLRLSQDFSAHALHVRAMPSSDIEATDSLDNLSLIAAAIGAVIIATLLGGSGAALLMSGPIGWILGLIIGAIVMFVGKKAAMGKARDIDLPKFLRLMTSEGKVRNKLQENRGELRRQLSTALRENASAFDETINRIAETAKDELEKKAEEAAMLIK